MKTKKNQCSRCEDSPVPGQRYYMSCHAAYMRVWRFKQRQELEQLRQVVWYEEQVEAEERV